MTTDIFGPSIKAERDERAKRAVSVFRAMQPGLTGYARAMTGNQKLTVEITEQGGSTDGKKIYFKPPIALGDMTPHNRSLCDKRDRESLHLLCPACRVREEVLIVIYHEIAHIAFGTFTKPTSQAKARAVEAAIAEVGTKYAQRVKSVYEALPDYKKDDYLNLASLVSPYLTTIINALEDARVDERMFQARRGTKVMFDALTQSVFREGYEEDDGTRTEWNTRPLNSQAIIGVFVLACEYKYEGWFDPEVEEALNDKKLTELSLKASKLDNAHESYNLGFKILARLRELGFCLNPNEPQDEDETEEEQQDGSDADQGTGTGDEEGDSDSEESSPSDSQGRQGGSQAQRDASPSEGEDSSGDSSGGCSGTGSPDSSSDGADSGEELDSDGSVPEGGTSGDSSSERGAGQDGPESRDSGDAGVQSEEEEGSGEGESADSDGTEDSGEAGRGVSGDLDAAESDGDNPEGTGLDDGLGGEDREEAGDGDDDGASDSSEPSDGELTDEQEGDSSREGSPRSGDNDNLAGPDAGGDDSTSDDSEPDLGPESDDLDGIEAVDSGADEGKGGDSVEHKEHTEPRPESGTAEQVAQDLQVFTRHDLKGGTEDVAVMSPEDSDAITQAVLQGLYFETSSRNVTGVREGKYNKLRKDGTKPDAWTDRWSYLYGRKAGQIADLDIPEQVLGPALLEMRRVFADNQRAKFERHLRSGKINQNVLGKRAWSGDDRLFQKKRLPGKKSYAVLLGIDISASTIGKNIALAKRAAMAQAELLNRAGLDFAVYAHSANDGVGGEYWLDVYEIKSFDAPWGAMEQKALTELGPDSENLDGHTIEYYRKMVERHPATDKIILYYSDGKMPASNHDEELEVLQREIAYCKKHNITLLGVGIRTDSPRRHGLDTVQVDDDSDIVKVVRHLKNALLHSR